MNVIEKNISELIDAEYNPRQLTEKQLEDLKNSVDKFGFVEPIVINTHTDRENVVVGGHQRIKIAKQLGLKKIPCAIVNLGIDAERELNVRLNKNSGQWDWDKLANEFDLSELVDWGFKPEELGVNETFLDDVTDISYLDDDESYRYNFTIKCETDEELERIKGIFKSKNKRINFDSAYQIIGEMSDVTSDN